jgi:hypothetical protein
MVNIIEVSEYGKDQMMEESRRLLDMIGDCWRVIP